METLLFAITLICTLLSLSSAQHDAKIILLFMAGFSLMFGVGVMVGKVKR